MATATTPPLETTPPNDDMLYEMVNGQIVEKYMGAPETQVASFLIAFLAPFAMTHRLGMLHSEMMFLIDPATNLQRRPDLAFVSHDRWPIRRRIPSGGAWNMVPDLAVEVVSPSNSGTEILAKLEEYFRAGVRLVWVIWPDQAKVYVYDSPTTVRILQVGDDLDGGAVVPGFQLPLADWFEEADAEPNP